MAFTGNWASNVFKLGLMNGVFTFSGGQVYKIALYTNAASLDAQTAGYVTDGEVVASGYAAGGNTLVVSQVPTPVLANNGAAIVTLSFDDAVWNASILARGALIYLENGTTNTAICVLDFGSDKQSSTTFKVQFPAASSTSAIIRIQ